MRNEGKRERMKGGRKEGWTEGRKGWGDTGMGGLRREFQATSPLVIVYEEVH